jgi:hypothetical protein
LADVEPMPGRRANKMSIQVTRMQHFPGNPVRAQSAIGGCPQMPTIQGRRKGAFQISKTMVDNINNVCTMILIII